MIQRIHEVTSGVKLIGVHGKAGSGKDSICYYLSQNYKHVYKEAFATPLKEACAKAFGLPVDFFNDTEMKELTNVFWNVSPRKMAQYVGTELFRNNIEGLIADGRSDFWIRRLTGLLNGDLTGADTNQGDYIDYGAEDTVVVTDVRFGNEADWIVSNGGIMIHITREGSDGNVGIAGHPSEADIDTSQMWLIVNDGSLEDLHEDVERFVTAYTNTYNLESLIDISKL